MMIDVNRTQTRERLIASDQESGVSVGKKREIERQAEKMSSS
jgi:hypothetical protein